MNRPEFFDIMSLVEDEHINILYERRAKAAENKLSAKGGKKLITLWFKRIALVLITTATVLAGILMLHEDVRAAVVNAFITWYDTYIQIDFSKIPEDTAQIDGTTDTVPADKEPEADTETQEPVENIYDLAVGYIPSGFKSVYTIEDNYTREYSYDDEDGNSLLIGIYDSKGTEVGVSNDDNYEYEKLLINNRETYVAYNEQEGIGSVSFGNDVYCVLISGASITDVLDKETLIKIAENIRKKDDTEDKEQTQEVKDIYKFEIGYIPDGFELSQSDENINYREYIYYNKSDQYLVVGIYLSKETEIAISKEDDAEYEKIKLNDTDAYIYYVESDKTGSITYSNSVYLVNITGIIEKDELIKIAENIREKDSNGEEEQDQEVKDIYKFEIGYIPDGFELMQVGEDDSSRNHIYYNEIGEYLVVGIYYSGMTEVNMDNEVTEHERVSINGYNGIFAYNEAEKTGYLTYGNTEYTFTISSILEKEEFIKIAENIKEKDSNGKEEQDQEVNDIYKFEIGYIPDGFELSQSQEDVSLRNYIYTNVNEPDEYLIIDFCLSEGSGYWLGYDDSAEYDQIKLNGTDAYIFYNKQEKTGAIMCGNSVYFVSITGYVEKDELIKIAENIREKDSNGEE